MCGAVQCLTLLVDVARKFACHWRPAQAYCRSKPNLGMQVSVGLTQPSAAFVHHLCFDCLYYVVLRKPTRPPRKGGLAWVYVL